MKISPRSSQREKFVDKTWVDEALRNSEVRLESLLAAAADAIVVIDASGIVESVNRACVELFGYATAEIVGKNVSILMPEPYTSGHDGYIANYLCSGEAKIIGKGRQVPGRRKDGSLFLAQLSVSEMEISGQRKFLGILRDLTRESAAVQDLLRSETTLKAVLRSAVDPIVLIDCKGIIVSVNEALERVFGYESGEVLGKNVRMLMPEPYHSAHDGYLEEYLRTGVGRIIGVGREVEAVRKDGAVFPVELSVSEVKLERVHLFTGMIRDLSQQKRRERALAEAREKAQKYLDVASVILLALDQNAVVTLINQRGCEVLGLASSEIVGQKWLDRFLPEAERAQVKALFDRIMAGETACPNYFENLVLSGRGEVIPVEWHSILLRDEAGAIVGTLSSGIDQREKKQLMHQLVLKESLARIGEMAAIVAHDIKNPLAGIISGSRMLLKRFPEASFEREVLNEILATTEGLNTRVKDILYYSRPRAPEKQAVPTQILFEAVKSLASKDPLFEKVEIHTPNCGAVLLCDVDMLKGVLLNLLQNSAQAMKGKGKITLTIETRNARCKVTVLDSGPGIPRELLPRIFEPFFTTKRAGTGLGLPIVKRIVELHDGTVTIDCPAEGGTQVVLELPAA